MKLRDLPIRQVRHLRAQLVVLLVRPRLVRPERAGRQVHEGDVCDVERAVCYRLPRLRKDDPTIDDVEAVAFYGRGLAAVRGGDQGAESGKLRERRLLDDIPHHYDSLAPDADDAHDPPAKTTELVEVTLEIPAADRYDLVLVSGHDVIVAAHLNVRAQNCSRHSAVWLRCRAVVPD